MPIKIMNQHLFIICFITFLVFVFVSFLFFFFGRVFLDIDLRFLHQVLVYFAFLT